MIKFNNEEKLDKFKEEIPVKEEEKKPEKVLSPQQQRIQNIFQKCKEFIVQEGASQDRGVPMSALGLSMSRYLKPKPFTGKFSAFLAWDKDFDVYQNRGKPQYVRLKEEAYEKIRRTVRSSLYR